jgi:micrococcal nuclease
MARKKERNYLAEGKKVATSQGRAAYFFFVMITAATVVLILIVLAQPGVQTSLARLMGLESDIQSTSIPQAIDYSELEQAKVTRVVDGDTAILEDSRRIRYLNIDTPESVKPNTPVQCYAKNAYELNRAMVENKEVWLKFDEQKEDRYGRLLVFVFLPVKNANDIEQSVNAYLVQMGYARSYIIKPNDTYAEEFAALELEAKRNNRGLWKECPNPFEE